MNNGVRNRMSVRFFTCKNCHEASSEYNEIHCEECEQSLCGCAIPEELKNYLKCWEDVWEYIDIDEHDNIVAAKGYESSIDTFKKYLKYDPYEYGLELKKEYCPICNKKKELEKDPEYEEYLRLKAKFEGES